MDITQLKSSNFPQQSPGLWKPLHSMRGEYVTTRNLEIKDGLSSNIDAACLTS